MILLIVCITAVLIVPIFIFVSRLAPFLAGRGHAQNVVEAAGLLAAHSLSRIVIADPAFGYVSLSNHPPEGTATRALDGEPLPVIGINTLVGTLRQNAIVADELKNGSMSALVDRDMAYLDATIRSLNTKLSDAVSSDNNNAVYTDMNGKVVNPVAEVNEFLKSNLPPNMHVESVKLSLGWLDGGSESTIPAPEPRRLARVNGEDLVDGKYEAFRDFPVGKKHFTFAGLDNQAHLVSTRKFKKFDPNHINSILKLECTLSCTDDSSAKVEIVTCCQPYSAPDQGTAGAMTLRFEGQPVPGLLSWHEFLRSGNFDDNKLTSFYVVGGDYPFDQKANMYESQRELKSTTSEQFAEHLYYWLRNGRLRPRIDSVLTMMTDSFRSNPNDIYTYQFMDDGSIERRIAESAQFPRPVVAEGQFTAMADTRIKSGASAIIFFRDNVKNLSIKSGKHAGQPLAGYPLNSGNHKSDEQLASEFSKRKAQPFGLALDIEIGGLVDRDSSAEIDIHRMRERTRSRAI